MITMNSHKSISRKSMNKAHLRLVKCGRKEKEPEFVNFFGLPPDARFPQELPKAKQCPNGIPADFGKRNEYGIPITGKR